MDLYTCRTSRFGFSSFRSEPFFFLNLWLFLSVGAAVAVALRSCVFYPWAKGGCQRSFVFSEGSYCPLTDWGREGGGGGLSRWTVRSCVMRWWREAERAALWGKASSDFTSRAFFLNQRAIKMKLHPEIMHETDVFMVFAAVFIVMHMHDGSISFFFFALAL